MLAGAAGAPHWEQAGPGCQGCRINKAAHRLAGREATGRRENRCLRSAADTKDLLSPPPRPWGAAPSSKPQTSGQVSQEVLGGREGQVLTSQLPLPLGACFVLPETR